MSTPSTKQLFTGRWPRVKILMYETEPVTVIKRYGYAHREPRDERGRLPDIIEMQDIWVRYQNGTEEKLAVPAESIDVRESHQLKLYYAHARKPDITYLIGIHNLTTGRTGQPMEPDDIITKAGSGVPNWFDYTLAPIIMLPIAFFGVGILSSFIPAIVLRELNYAFIAAIAIVPTLYLARRTTNQELTEFIQTFMTTGATTPPTRNPAKNPLIQFGVAIVAVATILRGCL